MNNQTITSARAKINKIIASGAILIDVRSPKNFKAFSLLNSFNFPVTTLAHNWKILKGFNKPIVLICEDGELSCRAKEILAKYQLDIHLGGAWKEFV